MQEHDRLYERHGALVEPELLSRTLEHACKAAGLHRRLLQRGVLGTMTKLPAIGVPTNVALVVLQLDEVQRPLTEDQEVDLGPRAVAVDELEVAPRVEWATVWEELADVLQALTLMCVLGVGDEMPARAVGLHATLTPPVVDPGQSTC